MNKWQRKSKRFGERKQWRCIEGQQWIRDEGEEMEESLWQLCS